MWLGCAVSGVGKDAADMTSVKCSWERAFWANARYLRNSKAPLDSRLKFWRSIAFGIGDYHFPGWRPAKAAASSVEAAHNKILSRILALRPSLDDSAATFSKRRNAAIARLKASHKLCVRSRWAFKLVTWMEHLHRHKDSVAFKLLGVQDDECLRTCRYLAGSQSLDAGATGTRAGRGYPLRWGAVWIEAVGLKCGGWENARRDKKLTASRVASLLTFLK